MLLTQPAGVNAPVRSPLSPSVRIILRILHHRYHALSLLERPRDPSWLLTPDEARVLSRCGAYPLTRGQLRSVLRSGLDSRRADRDKSGQAPCPEPAA
jgi:hypothetical protein